MFKLILYSSMFMMIFLIMMNLINKMNYKIKKINNLITIECGFNNMNNKHVPMYNNFFFIMIIFMIFDLEFFLFIPLINLMKNFNWIKFFAILILSLLFMFYSLMYEIKFNSIKWNK